MNLPKRMRGSAFTDEYGNFFFNPYRSLSDEEKNLKRIKTGTYSSLWIGKNTVSFRITFKKKAIPPFQVWIEEMTNMFNAAIAYQQIQHPSDYQ